MTQTDETELNRWKESRSGAWAGRGFHYQHLFATLILIRQWAGLAPAGLLVPEGLEDCVVELSDRDVWIQIKSRKCGTFSKTEVTEILAEVGKKKDRVKSNKKTQLAVGLEKPCSTIDERGVEQVFDEEYEKVVVCRAPEEEMIALFTEHLNTAEIIAEGIVSDLYKFVAEASAANASLPFESRQRISTTDVERRIFNRLEAEDPSAIDSAIFSRILEPVDLNTPIFELGFYQGVKVKPGHVVSGLVLTRPKETNSIISSLKARRHLLIAGPSGSGKSALMWLVVSTLAAEFRWLEVTAKAGVQDADAIIRFIRSRRPKKISPIGLVFDEVGNNNSDLWDVLAHELRSFSDVYLLGSVRREDVNLIVNQSDTALVNIALDEELAQNLWGKLFQQKQTSWPHWREPFEQSNGLMLEYVHLLTQGERLAALIGEQIRQREKEGRHDELAIIRVTSALSTRGGEINAKKLFSLLQLPPEQACRALKRLIDEHLVRESRPGVFGGLHALRSKALCDSSHDEAVYCYAESLWQGIQAVTSDTLPGIIQSVFANIHVKNEEDALRNLAELLAQSDDVDFWVAILTGLGLGTLERHVASFLTTMKEVGVQRAQWSLASMFVDASIDVPDLTEFEQWQSLRRAILEFRKLPKCDLRAACLEVLPKGYQAPICTNIRQANQMLSSLVPIAGGESIRMNFMPELTGNIEHNIQDIAVLLSTAYLLGADFAQSLVSVWGGEQALLTKFHSQMPWLAATPSIEEKGTHGRTVRANFFFVAEDYQSDPSKTVGEICKTLIALSPASDAAASDALDPSGAPIKMISADEHLIWSKNMPRSNLPAKARVAWNVAFRQILLARAETSSLTDYTLQMVALVQHTEKLFRSFSERWIKGSSIANADKLANEINETIKQVNSLAYAIPERPASLMTSPLAGAGTDDTLGALLTGVLGNLASRMEKIPAESGAKAVATFAASLGEQAKEHSQSPIWRTTSSPPLAELIALTMRLNDITCVLHEMAHDDSPSSIVGIVKSAKKGGIGKAIRSASRHCRLLADKRFQNKLRDMEKALMCKGWSSKCWTRPVKERDSIYWPPMEVAILIKVSSFETDIHYIMESIEVGLDILGKEWRFRVVPVVCGQVVPRLALLPSSKMPLPDLSFTEQWKSFIDLPFLIAETTDAFDQAVNACNTISSILNCRDLDNLHPEEDSILSKAKDTFEHNRNYILISKEKTGLDIFGWALMYLDEIWEQLANELETVKAGQKVDHPLCMNSYDALGGNENEKTTELANARILMWQAECGMVAQ